MPIPTGAKMSRSIAGTGSQRGWVLALLFLIAGPAAGQTATAPVFALPEEGSAVVVRLVEQIDGVESEEAGPTTTVFADGRVVVERPSYMKSAGRHEIRLTPEALRDWVGSLLETGVAAFDAGRARNDKAAADRATRLKRSSGVGTAVFERSSASRVDFELRVDAFAEPAKGPGDARPVRLAVEWKGLRGDARRYPELQEIQSLQSAVGMTRALEKSVIAPSTEAEGR